MATKSHTLSRVQIQTIIFFVVVVFNLTFMILYMYCHSKVSDTKVRANSVEAELSHQSTVRRAVTSGIYCLPINMNDSEIVALSSKNIETV